MTDIEKKILIYNYCINPDKLKADVEEFTATFESVTNIMGDEKKIKMISLSDIGDFLCALKEFQDNIKPFAIKYGIIPYLINGDITEKT